jgi:hypothetical protein
MYREMCKPGCVLLVILLDKNMSSFVCTDINFGGVCTTFHGSSGQCVNFSAEFNDDITSFGPDTGQDCFIFVYAYVICTRHSSFFLPTEIPSDINCGGTSAGPFRNPGVPDLSTINFNDKISSFQWVLILLGTLQILIVLSSGASLVEQRLHV